MHNFRKFIENKHKELERMLREKSFLLETVEENKRMYGVVTETIFNLENQLLKLQCEIDPYDICCHEKDGSCHPKSASIYRIDDA